MILLASISKPAPIPDSITLSKSEEKTESKKVNGEEKPLLVIEALGGLDNLHEVDACMTRLRVTVKNHEKVEDDSVFKALGAAGVIKKDKGIQIIFGPEADVLKSKINLIREGM